MVADAHLHCLIARHRRRRRAHCAGRPGAGHPAAGPPWRRRPRSPPTPGASSGASRTAPGATGSSSASATGRSRRCPSHRARCRSTSTSAPRARAPSTRSTRAATWTRRGRRPDARLRDRQGLRRLQARPLLDDRGALHQGQRQRRLGVLALVLEGPARLRPRLRRRPGKPYIYVKTISSSAPSARQPGGSRGSASSTPLEVELYGTRLAFAWRYKADRDAPAYDLRMDTVGGDHIRLDSTSGGGLSSTVLGWPSFESGRLFWLRSCVGDPGGCQSTRRFQQSEYTGTPQPLVATSPPTRRRWSATRRSPGRRPTSTRSTAARRTGHEPACAIEPLRPDYAPLN